MMKHCIQEIADRRTTNVEAVGLGWLLGLALLRVPALVQDTVLSRTVLLGAVGLALAAGTISRNTVYQTETAFWQDVAAKSPRNARAANNLGMAHALACEPLAARSAFERAAAIAPDDPQPQVNLALLERGELPGMPSSPACR